MPMSPEEPLTPEEEILFQEIDKDIRTKMRERYSSKENSFYYYPNKVYTKRIYDAVASRYRKSGWSMVNVSWSGHPLDQCPDITFYK